MYDPRNSNKMYCAYVAVFCFIMIFLILLVAKSRLLK